MSDSTNQVLFRQNKRQCKQLKQLVNLLACLIEKIETKQDTDFLISRAKSYLLIETNLALNYLDDKWIDDNK